MSASDNYDLPKSLVTSLPNEDDVLWLDHGNHPSIPPLPPIILPNPQVQGHSSPSGKQGLCVITSWKNFQI